MRRNTCHGTLSTGICVPPTTNGLAGTAAACGTCTTATATRANSRTAARRKAAKA